MHWGIRGATLKDVFLRRGFIQEDASLCTTLVAALKAHCTEANAILAMEAAQGDFGGKSNGLRWWDQKAIARGKQEGWRVLFVHMGGKDVLHEGVTALAKHLKMRCMDAVKTVKSRSLALVKKRKSKRARVLKMHGIA